MGVLYQLSYIGESVGRAAGILNQGDLFFNRRGSPGRDRELTAEGGLGAHNPAEPRTTKPMLATLTRAAPPPQLFLPRRAPRARPILRDARGAPVDPFLRQVAVRVGGRRETTRLLDPDDADYAEEVAALESDGFEPTRLHQARALVGAADFPRLSASFVARGDVFYAFSPRGEPSNCHARWDHIARRFEAVEANRQIPGSFVALTKVEYPG